MEDFIFYQGSVPEGYSVSFTESLFNKGAHRQLQAKSHWLSFFILNQKRKSIDGAIHFHLHDGIAQSPLKATSGGFDLNDGLPWQVISDFVFFIEDQLKKQGATKIFIKLPLRIAEAKEFDLVENTLMDRGFQIASKETGSLIKVESLFNNEIHHSEKKRLRKSTESHFKFEKPPVSELDTIYSFILQCRTGKGYTLSMSLQGIQDLADKFPQDIVLFAVKDKEKLVAASICIRVNQKVLYDFYHDHDALYNTYSPIVFLVNGINDYCFENKISILDLGTSMINNKVNTSLLEFKSKLGGKPGVKYSFEKKLK